MSTKRHGEKVVSDLSKAILFVVKQAGNITLEGIVGLLGNDFEEEKIRQRTYRLKYKGSLKGGTKVNISLTPRGIAALQEIELKAIKPPKKWDRKWRLVIFDIPENKRSARDQIRKLLKDLGFRQLQISVWAHPLPCFEQFRTIQKAYGIDKHLLLLEVNHSSDFNKLKYDFSKQYPVLKNLPN